MITTPTQIDFIPVLNIYPQPIYPAIYVPGVIPSFIPYNFVNYPQCDTFPHYSSPYEQNCTQSNSLPPGLSSPEDEVFYFHDFFFSKDDPGLGCYTEALTAAEDLEKMITIKQKTIDLSSLTMSIMNSIWSKQQHDDCAWGEVSIYKGQKIHCDEWKSLLIEFFQDQASLKNSGQMAKVICKLLESSTENSRFQKYCRSNPVHKISENYEDYDLLNELKTIFNDEQETGTEISSTQLERGEQGVVLSQEKPTIETLEGQNNKLLKELAYKKESLEIKRKVQELITSLTNAFKESVKAEKPMEVSTILENLSKEEHIQTLISDNFNREAKYDADAKENENMSQYLGKKNKRGSRRVKEVKSYSNEVESLPSDSDQVNQHKEKKRSDDQARIKLQNYREFEEDQNIPTVGCVSSIENVNISDLKENTGTLADEGKIDMKPEGNVKSKKSKKYRKRKGTKKAVETGRQIEPSSVSPVEENAIPAADIPNSNLSAHIEKLLQMTLTQEKEDKFEPWNSDDYIKNKMDKEEKNFSVMKEFMNDLSKEELARNHNSTLTGETSAKTETDISTEYEECKQEGSNQKVSKTSIKQNQQFNQNSKVYLEEQNMRQIDVIQSPRSGSNAENEYYLDMISNILSEDPNALEKLKEMLLSHSLNLSLPAGAGFTEEELQEIEEVNMELEKVMKRRFRDTMNDEEDETHLPPQEEKLNTIQANNQEHDLVGLSSELMSLSALLCDDFDEMALQKNHEIECNAFGIPMGTMSYLEELMRSRAEFMEVLQSGTKNI